MRQPVGTPDLRRVVARRLKMGIVTASDISVDTGAPSASIRRTICEMREAGEIHIAAWRLVATTWTAEYAGGAGKDKPRPKTRRERGVTVKAIPPGRWAAREVPGELPTHIPRLGIWGL